jgi:hypothetical protein
LKIFQFRCLCLLALQLDRMTWVVLPIHETQLAELDGLGLSSGSSAASSANGAQEAAPHISISPTGDILAAISSLEGALGFEVIQLDEEDTGAFGAACM